MEDWQFFRLCLFLKIIITPSWKKKEIWVKTSLCGGKSDEMSQSSEGKKQMTLNKIIQKIEVYFFACYDRKVTYLKYKKDFKLKIIKINILHMFYILQCMLTSSLLGISWSSRFKIKKKQLWLKIFIEMNKVFIMVLKTDIMNLNWSLDSLIPWSLSKKKNYSKL